MTTLHETTPTTFAEMGLADSLLTSITALGYTQPTAVQAALVPAALQGGDWIVASQTGSGKTAAFLLPALQQIVNAMASGKNNPANAPFTLVLCPTRELAQQVASDAINLVKATRGIRVATIVGGTSYFKQKQGLKGAQLVVATPGRLLDWVQQGGINLSQLHTLVLDEADRMLDLGFTDEINAIADACEHREQTLMFSATFTPRETKLAAALMIEPQQIMLASVQEKHENITQHLHWADNSHHQHQLLLHWLADPKLDQAVVFASTQVETERLADELVALGISATSLHGAMPQMVRNRRLESLRKGRVRVLVATDVAARGIDVPTISHVFNYGLPMKAEDYVHRIGRTGRAGREGISVTFAQRNDAFKIRQIERYINNRINVTQIKGLEPQLSHEDFKAGKPSKGRGGARNGARSGAPRHGAGRSGAPRASEGANSAVAMVSHAVMVLVLNEVSVLKAARTIVQTHVQNQVLAMNVQPERRVLHLRTSTVLAVNIVANTAASRVLLPNHSLMVRVVRAVIVRQPVRNPARIASRVFNQLCIAG